MSYKFGFLFFLCTSRILLSSVDHKDDFIDIYLNNIGLRMDEKTELLEHIQKNLNGTYIDIGTGGDAVALMVTQLPKTAKTTLIAVDVDPLVLESIPIRKPQISEYLGHKAQGPKVKLVPMCATKMTMIDDNSISGIGASALMHEIFSYVPAKQSVDLFVTEICRILEKDGVFIYRDPKWVDDPYTNCIMAVKNLTGKYYVSLFLPKFLDTNFSLHRDYRLECSKPNPYNINEIKFNIYLKNNPDPKRISYEEFVNLPTKSIDYNKNFSIEAPKGLIAEIQRHYLMFLRNEFTPGFISQANLNADIHLSDLSKDERDVLEDFCYIKKLPFSGDVIKKEVFEPVLEEYRHLSNIMQNGFVVDLSTNPEILSLINHLIDEKGVSRNLLFISDNKTVFIDPKLLSLLFYGSDKGIFKYLSKIKECPISIFRHLKLEGEEHYFYKTTDELITYFGQFSNHIMKNTHKHNLILAPIDKDHVKEVPRNYYQTTLENAMLVIDCHGNKHYPTTEKNIIHFKLQPLDQAMDVYHSLIKSHPTKFPMLTQWLVNKQKEKDFSLLTQ